ncbi:DUF2501 domain-containing protein [Sphingomonas profundi]|uniref:DUF2501 domain-containing protein n=1 Tax=Alterirhizorhabdus profundi TaxID=2681549 RepID=UPI0012E8FC05|nr:DUF2501 domain-containing protein [Sphingomonas profundi]
MRHILFGAALAAGIMLAPAAAVAQQAGAQSGGGLGGLMGGSGGLLGGVLPDVGGSTMSNATGLLSYCVKNNLLGATTNAKSALGKLMGQQGVTASDEFAQGQSGELVTENGTGLSLDSMKGKVKSKVCGMVLQHARSFL